MFWFFWRVPNIKFSYQGKLIKYPMAMDILKIRIINITKLRPVYNSLLKSPKINKPKISRFKFEILGLYYILPTATAAATATVAIFRIATAAATTVSATAVTAAAATVSTVTAATTTSAVARFFILSLAYCN